MEMIPTQLQYPSGCISHTGKIHVVKCVIEKGGAYYTPACNENFTLGVNDRPKPWKGTEKDPTCEHCKRLCSVL